jgi:hypothetical protein
MMEANMATERTPDPEIQAKRLHVQMLLNNPAWQQRSTRWIAREAGVSYALVDRIRRERREAAGERPKVRAVTFKLPLAVADAVRRHPSIDWPAVIAVTVTKAVRAAAASPLMVPTRRRNGGGEAGTVPRSQTSP